jgi:hypothetical protein
LFHADGQTGIHDEAKIRFSQIGNAGKILSNVNVCRASYNVRMNAIGAYCGYTGVPISS